MAKETQQTKNETHKPNDPKRLTAEGWWRLMEKKTGKQLDRPEILAPK